MKTYIFYTSDGFSQDESRNSVENCQVLGWSAGENPEMALEKLKESVALENWNNICCQELKSDKVFYF